MAYVLNAVIAEASLLRERFAAVVGLPGGFGLAPLTDAQWQGRLSLPLMRAAELRGAPDDEFAGPEERRAGLDRAAEAFAWISEACARLSTRQGARVAYVEASYFGGRGGQACAVWEAGELVLGPIDAEWVMALALAMIGVERAGGVDEFEVLQLGRFRSSEEWLASV